MALRPARVVVVAAAGNRGRNPNGRDAYGGITAPGNAPWVLTAGASTHMGTTDRGDDGMAAFSSRGPAAIDDVAKPDVVAPGVGIGSLSDPASAFYTTKAQYLLRGTVATPSFPYLSLSGTSMAAPVVAGTVALMLQADPALTPNAVKAILQFTSQAHADYGPLTQGAGFIDAAGAVAMARFFANPAAALPSSSTWSRHLIWGNQRLRGGELQRRRARMAGGHRVGQREDAVRANHRLERLERAPERGLGLGVRRRRLRYSVDPGRRQRL